MHYCSVECQRNDWQQWHRLECKSFKNCLQQKQAHLLESDMSRLFIRLLIRGQNVDIHILNELKLILKLKFPFFFKNDTSICDEIGLKSFDTLKDRKYNYV